MTIAIQEALLCPFLFKDELHVAIVLRRGRNCHLLNTLTGVHAAISSSPDGLKTIQEILNVPCRVLDGEEGAFLAQQTILAEGQGRSHYHLKAQNSP